MIPMEAGAGQGSRKCPANRRWTTGKLEVFLAKYRAGAGEADLTAEFCISAAYVRVLLRYADSLRLQPVRRRTRWDGSGDPWQWLSTPVYRHVRAQGLETADAVRMALMAGTLRDQGRKGRVPRRAISAELWRWLSWMGSERLQSVPEHSQHSEQIAC